MKPAGEGPIEVGRATRAGRRRTASGALWAVAFAAGLVLPAAAGAAPPQVTGTSFSGVTESSASLAASVDPRGAKVRAAHFDYIPLSAFEHEGFGAATLSTPAQAIPAQVTGPGILSAGSPLVSGVATSEGTFAAGQTIEGKGIPSGTTVTEVGGSTLTLSKPAGEAGTVEL